MAQVKPARIAVGLMSGTSVDGIDAALVRLSEAAGHYQADLLAFENIPYAKETRARIFSLFETEKATVDRVGAMNFELGELFADAALRVIEKAGFLPAQVDFIGSHGQTIYHDARGTLSHRQGCSVQIGEGAVIAAKTGITCVSDFRVADIANGGEGAPLVPFTEYLLFRRPGQTVLMQNLGGIGNITALPSEGGAERVYAFDTGPGNMLIDALVSRLYDGLAIDRDGAIAQSGHVHDGLFRWLSRESYFSLPPPKSTGREWFGSAYAHKIAAFSEDHAVRREDVIATVTYLTAWSIADAYEKWILPKDKASTLILSGGGSYNPTLVGMIRKAMGPFGVETETLEQLGGNADAKEAVAFAVLADFTLRRMDNSLPRVTGARKAAVMGKISWGGALHDDCSV